LENTKYLDYQIHRNTNTGNTEIFEYQILEKLDYIKFQINLNTRFAEIPDYLEYQITSNTLLSELVKCLKYPDISNT